MKLNELLIESPIKGIKLIARKAAKTFVAGGREKLPRNPHAGSFHGDVWQKEFNKELKKHPEEVMEKFDEEDLEFLVGKMQELLDDDAAEDIEDAAYGVVEIETQDDPLTDEEEDKLVRQLISLYRKNTKEKVTEAEEGDMADFIITQFEQGELTYEEALQKLKDAGLGVYYYELNAAAALLDDKKKGMH